MKKKIGISVEILRNIAVLTKAILKVNDNKVASVSIIGSADGPTTIFLVGKLGRISFPFIIIIGIILMIIITGLFILKHKH